MVDLALEIFPVLHFRHVQTDQCPQFCLTQSKFFQSSNVTISISQMKLIGRIKIKIKIEGAGSDRQDALPNSIFFVAGFDVGA